MNIKVANSLPSRRSQSNGLAVMTNLISRADCIKRDRYCPYGCKDGLMVMADGDGHDYRAPYSNCKGEN